MNIPLNDVEQLLVGGWINVQDIDLSRLVLAGQTVTVILSDGPFVVPETLPGGAVTLASKQHQFSNDALLKMRVLTRGT